MTRDSADLRALLAGDADTVAPEVLGLTLVADSPDGTVAGRIVEVEAYTSADPASHSHRGPTGRNASMFAGGGHLYVYLIYGVHHCANVVTGPSGDGQAVLIRAVEPVAGAGLVATRRPGVPLARRTDGPGKVCAAFGIDRSVDGLDLLDPGTSVRLEDRGDRGRFAVGQGPRVGLRVGRETPWRWWIER